MAWVMRFPMNPIGEVQKEIADIIRNEPWFSTNRVEVMEKDAQGLSFVIGKGIRNVDHVVVTVAVDTMQNNYSAVDTSVTITVRECVQLNRTRQPFVTALQVVQAIIQKVDGTGWWHWNSMEQREDAKNNAVECTAKFSGMMDRLFEEEESSAV